MKRRLLTMVLALVLLASTVVAPVGASAASKKVKLLQVTTDGARVRSGPSTEYDVKTSLKKGSKVFYLGKIKNSFAYVRTAHGIIGYMYRGFLKNYGVTYLNQVYYCKSGSAGVYKRASKSSGTVTYLDKYQHVIVYQVKGSWAYIKTLGGRGGYVKKSVLKKAS